MKHYLELFVNESVGLCNGAYGCVAVGVDEFEASGLCWCCWNILRPSKSLWLLGLSPICCETDCDRFISLSELEFLRPLKLLRFYVFDAYFLSFNLKIFPFYRGEQKFLVLFWIEIFEIVLIFVMRKIGGKIDGKWDRKKSYS